MQVLVFQPLQNVFCITAEELDFAVRKEATVGKAEVIQKRGIDKGRESEAERWNCALVDSLRHDEDLTPLKQNRSCPPKNELSCWCWVDTVPPISDQQRESDVSFQNPDLMTDSWLRR